MSEDGAKAIVIDQWPRPSGYSNVATAAAAGRLVVTAGMIGWDPLTEAIESDNFASQTAQALRNIVDALAAAGAVPTDLVRLTWYVTNRDEYLASREGVGVAYRQIIGKHYPAMAVVVVAGLIEPRAKVEIEATAVVPASRS